MSDVWLHFLSDGLYLCPPEEESKLLWVQLEPEREQRRMWDLCCTEILADWINLRPGTRPSLWWAFESPAPRLRLGGIGDPDFEHLGVVPAFEKGIPESWVSQWEADYYNGLLHNVEGNPIGTHYKNGDFKGTPISRDDPPRYESQAAYLRRNSLLLPGEERRLTATDFEPEPVANEGEAA